MNFFFSLSSSPSPVCLHLGHLGGQDIGDFGGLAGRGGGVDGGDGSKELRRGLDCWESGRAVHRQVENILSARADLVPNPVKGGPVLAPLLLRQGL